MTAQPFTLEHPTPTEPKARRTAPRGPGARPGTSDDHAHAGDASTRQVPRRGSARYDPDRYVAYHPPTPDELAARTAREVKAQRVAHLAYYGVRDSGDRDVDDAAVRAIQAEARAAWVTVDAPGNPGHVMVRHRATLPPDHPEYRPVTATTHPLAFPPGARHDHEDAAPGRRTPAAPGRRPGPPALVPAWDQD